MVATVIINEKNDAGAKTPKTSATVRFKNDDNSDVDTLDPMVVPTGNSDYSFEKWLQLECTVAPDTEITNGEVYCDGTLFGGTDVEIWGKVITAFATPAEGTGTTGTPSTPTATANIEGWTTGAAQALTLGTVTGIGDMGDHVVLVMEVTSSATQGTLAAETLTFRYDEI